MRSVVRMVVGLAGLLAVWMLMLTSLEPLDLVIGLPIAAGALVLSVRLRTIPGSGASHEGGPSLPARLAATPVFVVATVLDVIRGSIDVALVTVHLRPLRDPGVVEIPIGERTELGIVVTSMAANLSPGSVLIDVDHERGLMLFHLLDAGDPDEARATFARRYERYQRRMIP